MSNVKRKQLKKRRHGKLIFLLALLLLALGVGLAAYLIKNQPAKLPEIKKADPIVLIDLEESQVSSITIQNAYDTAYTLKNTGEKWAVAGDEAHTLRETMVTAIVTNACYLETEEVVIDLAQEDGVTAADFGIHENAARVRINLTDGTQTGFAIGDVVHADTAAFYYCQVDGDSRIYTVTVDVWEAFTNSRMALREVTDPALNGSLIDRIAFAGSDPFVLEKRYDGWYMAAPFAYPLDDGAMEELLSDLEGVRFAQLVGDAAALDLQEYGLDAPRRTLTLDIAESILTGYDENDQVMGEERLPAYQLAFEIGNDDSDVVFFCRYRDEVVKVTRFSADFMLTQGWETLLSTAPFNAPTNDLLAMTWDDGAAQRRYTFELTEQIQENNEFATDENGNILYDLHVYDGENEVSSADFLYAYRSLLQLRTQRRLPQGYSVSGAAQWTIAITRSGGTRTVSLYEYDALHNAVAIDGVPLFYVEKGWAEGIVWP